MILSLGVSAVDCQVSTDNMTWGNVSSAIYGGYIDNDNNISVIQNLEEYTTYYARCKNETDNWGYQIFTTTESGEHRMVILAMLGLHFFFLAIVLFFGIASYKFDDFVAGTLCAMGVFIWGIYILNSGFSGIHNDITNYLGWAFIGMGIYFMTPVFQWAVDELNLTGG